MVIHAAAQAHARAATRAGKAPVRSEVTITIDGPAGTGKSTTARLLARRLGLEFLDTGAMYRAAALIALEAHVDLGDAKRIAEAVRLAEMRFDWSADPPRLWLSSPEPRDVTDRLRDNDVTLASSAIARLPEVRAILVAAQRRLRTDHPGLVSEGRDQGSVVFPDADVKFFLDATPQARARRRAEQLRAAGQSVDEPRLLAEIIERDEADRNRDTGPLIIPDDAVVIDTTHMTHERVLAALEREVAARLGPLD